MGAQHGGTSVQATDLDVHQKGFHKNNVLSTWALSLGSGGVCAGLYGILSAGHDLAFVEYVWIIFLASPRCRVSVLHHAIIRGFTWDWITVIRHLRALVRVSCAMPDMFVF